MSSFVPGSLSISLPSCKLCRLAMEMEPYKKGRRIAKIIHLPFPPCMAAALLECLFCGVYFYSSTLSMRLS